MVLNPLKIFLVLLLEKQIFLHFFGISIIFATLAPENKKDLRYA